MAAAKGPSFPARRVGADIPGPLYVDAVWPRALTRDFELIVRIIARCLQTCVQYMESGGVA